MAEVSHHLTAADLHDIASGLGLRPASPHGVLDTIAAARHEDLETSAGMLFKVALAVQPFAENSEIFALEAARVLLYVNGMRLGSPDVARATSLVSAVGAGHLEDATEIGKRLVALDL